MRHVFQATAHEALDRGDGIGGVLRSVDLGLDTDLAALTRQVTHHRGQDHLPIAIGQALCHTVAYRRHQRMGRPQVDTHGNTPLMRVQRLAGFGNLQ